MRPVKNLKGQNKNKKFQKLQAEDSHLLKGRAGKGYFLFFALAKACNKGGQLKKTLRNLLVGLLKAKKSRGIKILAKINIPSIFYLLQNRLRPVYYNHRLNLGRKTFIIPKPLHEEKKILYASRWLKKAFKAKKGIQFEKAVSNEILDLILNKGVALKYSVEATNIAKTNMGNMHRKFRKKKKR